MSPSDRRSVDAHVRSSWPPRTGALASCASSAAGVVAALPRGPQNVAVITDLPRRRAEDRAAPLRRSVLILVALTTVLTGVMGGLLAVTVADLRAAQRDAQSRLLPAVIGSQDLLELFINQETGERGYVITGDAAFLTPYDIASVRIPETVAELSSHVHGLADAQNRLDAVMHAHEAWLADSVRVEIAAARSGDLAQARQLVATGTGRTRFDVLRVRADELQQELNATQRRSNDRITRLTQRLVWLVLIALVLGTCLIASLYPALQLLVLRPLHNFAAVARRAGHDLTQPVSVRGPREVVSAARDVESMRRRLVREINTARHAVEALSQRGPAVLELRAALAPQSLAGPGLAVASRLTAAEGFLAGDWFDAMDLAGERVAIMVGDVAGHGPAPAVFALRLKHLLSAALHHGHSPGEALAATAHQIGDTGELFATIFLAVIDVNANQLSYANAGHPAALLLSSGSAADAQRPRAEPAVELTPTGPLLSSAVDSPVWQTLTHDFTLGDLLVAYTDGVIEARDASDREYGHDRLLAVVSAATPAPEPVLDRLMADLHSFTAHQAKDDVTLVACQRIPHTAPPDAQGGSALDPTPHRPDVSTVPATKIRGAAAQVSRLNDR